ncbi:hypothetical protein [Wolbachia endosymbiont (group B) of Horisme vitalbata]
MSPKLAAFVAVSIAVTLAVKSAGIVSVLAFIAMTSAPKNLS